MNNKELGNRYIKLGKLIKSDNARLSDLVAAAFDCGLIFTFGLTPSPAESVDIMVGEEEPETVSCPQ